MTDPFEPPKEPAWAHRREYSLPGYGCRLYRFAECVSGKHAECPIETRDDSCICGCHAETGEEWD